MAISDGAIQLPMAISQRAISDIARGLGYNQTVWLNQTLLIILKPETRKKEIIANCRGFVPRLDLVPSRAKSVFDKIIIRGR